MSGNDEESQQKKQIIPVFPDYSLEAIFSSPPKKKRKRNGYRRQMKRAIRGLRII